MCPKSFRMPHIMVDSALSSSATRMFIATAARG
jgi:hypothetical protein